MPLLADADMLQSTINGFAATSQSDKPFEAEEKPK